MLVLLGDINLWSLDEDINIKDTDFGAFKYHEKRIDGLYEEGKRAYCQKRGMVSVLQNKKGNKLKDGIKYLEDQLRDHSTVYCRWHDEHTVQLVLGNGLLVYIQVNVLTADIQKIMFDKYLVGKISDHVSDVTITKNHLVFTHNDSQVTVVNFTKPKRLVFDKISKLEPRLSVVELSGPGGRRQDKKICVNRTGDLILVWWKSTMNEVYPWSPAVKDHDRANVHLYRLTGTKFELVCYLRTEFDPLCIIFNSRHDNVIHSVEQKVSRKGEVTIEWQTYEVSQQDKLQRIEVISVPLPTHTSCAQFSPNQDMLLLCCIDGSITLHDHKKGMSNNVKAPFIPTLASWHGDGFVFTVGNERGQFQHYDISMGCIRSQMLNEDATPAVIFDLSTYFRFHWTWPWCDFLITLVTLNRTQPALMRMTWNRKSDPGPYSDHYNNGDSLFLLLFERGPLGVIRVIEGNNLSGDVLICRNLNVLNVDRATSLLLAMNWDTHPRACMHSLNQILNHLFKLKLTPERESLIQNALGSFHVPIRPISQAVEDEYGDEIRDLTRRFFHHLIRYRLFEKAFRLAIDLNDHDLFMDIHFYALVTSDMEMATAAKEKAQNVLSRSNSCSSSHSTCSRSSCSLCSDSISDKEGESYSGESESEDSPKRVKSKVHLPSRHFSRGSSSKIPPLPAVHPSLLKNSGLMSTSFSDVAPKNSDSLMSTAFNIPNSGIAESSINASLAMPKVFPSDYAKRTPYRMSSGMMPSLGNNSQSYNNLSDDLISATFGNLRLLGLNQRDRSFAKSTGSVCQPRRGNGELLSGSMADDCLISTSFNNATPDLESLDMPTTLSSSLLGNIDTNVMSTSFSNLAQSSMRENNTSSVFRNGNPAGLPPVDMPHVSFGNSATTNKTSTSYNTIIGKGNALSFFNSGSNLMSTSFNDPEEETLESLERNINVDIAAVFEKASPIAGLASNDSSLDALPPPPTMTSSLANYLNNLPKKNSSLSRSAIGLGDLNDAAMKFPMPRPNAHGQMLQRQSSVSSILQSQHRNNNFQPIRNYRLNYDLDYVPFYGSSENLDYESGIPYGDSTPISSISHFQSHFNCQSKPSETKNPRLGISQGTASANANKETNVSFNVPPLPVLNASNSKMSHQYHGSVDSLASNEKPKVKFSNTVTHILVPGTGQPYRPIQKRSVTKLHPMDPKRELAESLPLCLGNEDYLKDFQPLSRDEEMERAKEAPKAEEAAKIKVVHFGLL